MRKRKKAPPPTPDEREAVETADWLADREKRRKAKLLPSQGQHLASKYGKKKA